MITYVFVCDNMDKELMLKNLLFASLGFGLGYRTQTKRHFKTKVFFKRL